MATFDSYAGQLVPDGIRVGQPLVSFEDTMDQTALQNLNSIKGLLPKIGKVIFHETRIKANPLEPVFRKFDLPYGAAVEEAIFDSGVADKKAGNYCIPRGDVDLSVDYDIINFAYNTEIMIHDREITKAILTPGEKAMYINAKLRTAPKTINDMRYKAMVQMISDVTAGTRSISSNSSSDGNGTSVTYTATCNPYVASSAIMDSQVVLPALVQGTIPTFANGITDVVTMLDMLQNAATEMREESTSYNRLGVTTHIEDRPWLIMESKVLNAMDSTVMQGASQRLPTRTAREFVRTFADLIEINSFADLPTPGAGDPDTSNNRCAGVLLDKTAASEHVAWEASEAGRCHNNFSTGYVWSGESAMNIFRGAPAAALLVDLT